MTAVVQAPAAAAFSMSIKRGPGPFSDGLSEIDAAWPSRLRRIVRARLIHWRCPGLIDTAELLITELATNALRHGKGDSIRVHMSFDAHRCVIEVTDGSSDHPKLRCAGPYDEGGRGLLLVDAMADAWGVSKNGRTTWCTFRISAGRP